MNNINELDLKEEIKKINKYPGKERAVGLKYLIKYIIDTKGEEELQGVIDLLSKNGWQVPDIEKYNDMDWIPECWINNFFVGAAVYFNWTNDDMKEAGRHSIKINTTIKMFVQYFVSFEKTMKKALANINRFFSDASAKLVFYDKSKKEAIFRIHNLYIHPFSCVFLLGTFESVGNMMSGYNIRVEETKCISKGDKYHEYLIKW